MPLIIINFIFKTFPKKGNLDQHLKIHNKEQKVTDSLPSHPLINLYLVLLIFHTYDQISIETSDFNFVCTGFGEYIFRTGLFILWRVAKSTSIHCQIVPEMRGRFATSRLHRRRCNQRAVYEID